ncbi:uncharacterized protein LOC127710915 [Mytilus californianus]|uniref:uncharacterized protein LOC127710915 n=1 Tax=Mytilus californianus TaxID=6549 RepID=UPI002245DDD0|nr:uncharacterized protein LOC127710915 [Mytilus californianus]
MAGVSDDFLKKILRLCFSVKEPAEPKLKALKTPCYNVTDRLFSNVKIEATDAAYSAEFSDAFVKYDIRSDNSIPLPWFWIDSIEDIVKSCCGESNCVDDATVSLEEFLRDEDNIRHLLKVQEAKTEAEIQAIISHHLFSKLAPSGSYILNADCNPLGVNKCPVCNVELVLGNTSLGNYLAWYGHPHILVDRSTVKVQIEESESDDEIEDNEQQQSGTKRLKMMVDAKQQSTISTGADCKDSYSLRDTHKDYAFRTEKALRHVFAQTITNAFYQAKQNPEMEDIFIPSFLVSDVKLKILMYNCKRDRLYISDDMLLFEAWSENGINVGTIVSIWLALNLENFKQDIIDDEVYETIGHGKSTFQENLHEEVLLIYKHQLQKPLSGKKWPSDSSSSTTLGRRVVRTQKWIETYDKLESLAANYFTESAGE